MSNTEITKFEIQDEPEISKENFEKSWNSRKYPMTIEEIEENIDHLDMNQVLFCRADTITTDFLNRFKNRTAKYLSVESEKVVFIVGDCCDILTKHTDLNATKLDNDIIEYISNREYLTAFSKNTYKYTY